MTLFRWDEFQKRDDRLGWWWALSRRAYGRQWQSRLVWSASSGGQIRLNGEWTDIEKTDFGYFYGPVSIKGLVMPDGRQVGYP